MHAPSTASYADLPCHHHDRRMEQLHIKIEVLEALVKRNDHLLFGNGQPGLLKELQDGLAELKLAINPTDLKQQKRDIELLKKNMWKTAGAAGVLLLALETGGADLLKRLLVK